MPMLARGFTRCGNLTYAIQAAADCCCTTHVSRKVMQETLYHMGEIIVSHS